MNEKTEAKIQARIKHFNEIAEADAEVYDDARQKAFNLQIMARQNLDKWIFSIITLSSAIFGVSLSSLFGKELIVNKYFFLYSFIITFFKCDYRNI